MDSTNTLKIVIDSKGAKSNADALDKSLKNLETQGDKTSKSAKGVGDGFDKSKKSLFDFNKMSDESINKLKTLAKVSGVVAGSMVAVGTAVAGMAMSHATAAKELQNQAVLADANVVEFQRMAVAAQSYGISQEQLSDQLKDFNEKLGEFTASGAGGAKDAFEMLHKEGLMTTEQIKKLALEMQNASGPQALQMYVNELEKAGVSQEQMSWYLETMASDLTKLAPALTDNGKEMKRLADEAERLGVIMDEEAVAQAVELEKQMSLLKKQAQGATNQFMTGLIPSLTSVATALNDGAEKSALFEQAGEDMGAVLKGVAVVAMGAYVAISSVSRAIIATAQDAADAAKTVSGLGLPNWLKPGQGAKNLLTAGLMTFGGKNGQEAKETNKKAAEDYATFVERVYAEVEKKVRNAKDDLERAITEPPKKNGKTTGLDEELLKWGKGAGDSAAAAAREAERAAEEIARIRERYTYQYADRAKQIEIELQEQLADIRKAGMGAEYEARAKQWAELEKKYFDAQLDYENKEYKLNEREKLAYRMYMSEIATQKDSQLTNDQKRARLKAISDQTNFELDQIILTSDKRIFEAEREFMSRQEQIKKLGELERREIQLNASLTAEERKRLEMASMRKTDMESNEARASAWGDYESMSGDLYGTSELVNIKTQLEERRAIIEEARAQDLIDTEEYNSRLREIEFDAWTQRQQFNITQAQNTFGAATEIMKNAFGEQSKAYQVMFAIEKSFAIANAGLSMVNNISKAASVGFPANLPLIAGAMAQAAQISSLIASVAAPKTTGFADGGYTGDGGKYDVAGLVHRGEIVWSQDDIKRAGGKNVVEAMRTGQKQQQSSPSVSPINQTIANFIDPALFEQFLRSDAGQRAFINTISDNSTAIRRAL